jgi:vacuolar iron transporter family protein
MKENTAAGQQSWFEEKQSAWLYRQAAAIEPDERVRRLFEQLADAAEQQAKIWNSQAETFSPGLRARLVARLMRRFGPRHIRPVLAAMKVRGLSAYDFLPPGHPMPTSVSDVGRSHKGFGGGNLRAAVFGVNDGLVSNTCLILGVAGAGVATQSIVASGVAGLLAGAFSMAAGEYVSMRSQREMFEYQIGLERQELAEYPEEEAEELALIYAARGMNLERAREFSSSLMRDPQHALDVLAREELGLNPHDLGSPWGAAAFSFVAFAAGASVPLIPWLTHPADLTGLLWSGSLAGGCLFAVGAALSLFTGRNAALGGIRMLAIGAAAGALTFLIGRYLGALIS